MVLLKLLCMFRKFCRLFKVLNFGLILFFNLFEDILRFIKFLYCVN